MILTFNRIRPLTLISGNRRLASIQRLDGPRVTMVVMMLAVMVLIVGIEGEGVEQRLPIPIHFLLLKLASTKGACSSDQDNNQKLNRK